MLPPAPVTKTTLPARLRANNSASGGTGSRPKRSSISSSLMSCTVTRPLARSTMPGNVRIWTGSDRKLSIMAFRLGRGTLGNASRISVTLCCVTTAGTSTGANTGTPLMLRPIFAGSSSTKPSKTYCPETASAEAVCTPAIPAPKMSSRPSIFSRRPPSPASQNRAIARLAPTSSKKIRGCRIARLRGTPGHCCHSSTPSSKLAYTATALVVVSNATWPVYLKIARYRPNRIKTGTARTGAST